MKGQLPTELIYQVSALAVSVILVHLFYVTTVRPNAEALIADRAEQAAAGQVVQEEQSIYLMVKDFEQEACFVLMLWAIAIMAWKGRSALRERALLQQDLVPLSEGMSILPEDSRQYIRAVEALPDRVRACLLPRTLLSALQRFASTRNVHDVSIAVRAACDTESDRLDSELSMVRYIAWAIPSIGFIGTVRGISQALGQAHRAVEGDIAGVTANLGVAFNSTFIALVVSILIMFLMHQLQQIQERLVLDVQAWCDHRLLGHMQVRKP